MPRDDSLKEIARQVEEAVGSDGAVHQMTVVATKESVRRILGIPDSAWAVGVSPQWLVGGEVRAVHAGQTGEIHITHKGFPALRQEGAIFPDGIATIIKVVMPQEQLILLPGKHPELERKMARISRKAILTQEKASEDIVRLIADEAPGSAENSTEPPETLHPAPRKKRHRNRS